MNAPVNETSIPTPPDRRWWPRALMSLFVFTCGGVVGAAGGGLWMRSRMIQLIQHPDQLASHVLLRIDNELALTDDQRGKVESILQRRFSAMEALRAESYPRQLAEFRRIQSDVSEFLKPDQKTKWDSLSQTIEQRFLPKQPYGPPPADGIFYRFDSDHDDSLSEDEVPIRMWQRLRNADLNGDGKVAREEYSSALLRNDSK